MLFFGQPWKKLASNKFYPIGLFFFNRLVRYSYWRYSRSWLIEFNGLNKLKLRFLPRPKGLGLLGFKVHLRGRFSRKQKASSLWYMRGQLPLTSVRSTVDYAFKAYPLRNSLVSVKVWLYKGIFAAKWFVRQF